MCANPVCSRPALHTCVWAECQIIAQVVLIQSWAHHTNQTFTHSSHPEQQDLWSLDLYNFFNSPKKVTISQFSWNVLSFFWSASDDFLIIWITRWHNLIATSVKNVIEMATTRVQPTYNCFQQLWINSIPVTTDHIGTVQHSQMNLIYYRMPRVWILIYSLLNFISQGSFCECAQPMRVDFTM